jgi:hypothetical protein
VVTSNTSRVITIRHPSTIFSMGVPANISEMASSIYLVNTLPPIILNAGVPLIRVSLAKMA